MNQSPRTNRRDRRTGSTPSGPRAPRGPAPERGWRDRISPLLITSVIGAVAIVGMLTYVIVDQLNAPAAPEDDASTSLPGAYFPELGRAHFDPGEVYNDYSSNPPTSGPHASSPAPWGISENPIPKETLIHNMEHGGVLVLYNCADGCPDAVASLSDYTTERLNDGDSIVMAPYPSMDAQFALVSWTRLDTFDELDMDRVDRFVDEHLCRYDPENVCG